MNLRNWPAEHDAVLRRLVKEPLTWVFHARVFNRTESAVRRRWQELRLPRLTADQKRARNETIIAMWKQNEKLIYIGHVVGLGASQVGNIAVRAGLRRRVVGYA